MSDKGKVEKALDELVENRNPKAILGLFARANLSKIDGKYCSCENPEFVGFSVICEKCGMYNFEREKWKEAEAKKPHEFKPLGLTGASKELCYLCAKYKSNPIHQEGDNQ